MQIFKKCVLGYFFAGILSDSKRIKLIMQVFKFNNAKTEPVAVEKFKIWWFFITKLGSKAPVYFDQVWIVGFKYGLCINF